MKFLIAAAAAATLLPAVALAQTAPPTGLYGTLGYANAHAGDFNLGAVQGRLGWRFNDWLGVEGELGFGVNDDKGSQTVGGVNVNTSVKLKDQEAIYAVGFLPLSNQFDLLARIGYGHQSVKASATATGTGGPITVSDRADGDSWNFGVGAQYHFDGANGVRADYTREEFRGSGSDHADIWAIAFSHRF
ncbi:MAG: porin family protein [Phenylobacterium sp.]